MYVVFVLVLYYSIIINDYSVEPKILGLIIVKCVLIFFFTVIIVHDVSKDLLCNDHSTLKKELKIIGLNLVLFYLPFPLFYLWCNTQHLWIRMCIFIPVFNFKTAVQINVQEIMFRSCRNMCFCVNSTLRKSPNHWLEQRYVPVLVFVPLHLSMITQYRAQNHLWLNHGQMFVCLFDFLFLLSFHCIFFYGSWFY